MRPMALLCFALPGIAQAQPAFAASDPFVGKWRLNVSRSMIVDEMRVEAVGPNRFAFNFEGGPRETIVADGSDQPALPGTTLAVKSDSPQTLTIVRKQDGQIIVSAHWKLAANGRTLRDSFTSLQPDGSNVTINYVYKRMAGTMGFAGTWQSRTKPTGLRVELEIEAYDGNGLSFITSGSKKRVIFDGREHGIAGDREGSSLSGRRIGARTIEYLEKSGGSIQRQRRLEVSRDGRALTETLRTAGQATPDVLVFERE